MWPIRLHPCRRLVLHDFAVLRSEAGPRKPEEALQAGAFVLGKPFAQPSLQGIGLVSIAPGLEYPVRADLLRQIVGERHRSRVEVETGAAREAVAEEHLREVSDIWHFIVIRRHALAREEKHIGLRADVLDDLHHHPLRRLVDAKDRILSSQSLMKSLIAGVLHQIVASGVGLGCRQHRELPRVAIQNVDPGPCAHFDALKLPAVEGFARVGTGDERKVDPVLGVQTHLVHQILPGFCRVGLTADAEPVSAPVDELGVVPVLKEGTTGEIEGDDLGPIIEIIEGRFAFVAAEEVDAFSITVRMKAVGRVVAIHIGRAAGEQRHLHAVGERVLQTLETAVATLLCEPGKTGKLAFPKVGFQEFGIHGIQKQD